MPLNLLIVIRSASSRGPSSQARQGFRRPNVYNQLSKILLELVKCTTTQKQGSSLLTTGQCDSVEGNDVYSPLHCITSCKGFKLVCININSLFKHIDEIRYILINSPLEVLAINESKLDDTISDTEVCIPGYIIIRKDRSRSGGGVALYIRENLSYTNRIDLVPVVN